MTRARIKSRGPRLLRSHPGPRIKSRGPRLLRSQPGLNGVLAALSLCFVLSLSALPVLAQDTGEDRATSFQAVEGARHEDVPGGQLLVGAYAVVLVLLVGYVARLGMMHRKTASDVERLSRLLETQRKA